MTRSSGTEPVELAKRMIFTNYLSTKDRERLKQIEQLLQNSTTMEERAELFAKREKIESKRKPLHECNITECMELTQQLYDQLQQHVNLGNRTQVKQFQSMIEGVNQRTLALHSEMNKDAIAKQEAIEKKNRISVDDDEAIEKKNRISVDDDDDESSNNEESGRSTKKRTTSNRWTISVDKFD